MSLCVQSSSSHEDDKPWLRKVTDNLGSVSGGGRPVAQMAKDAEVSLRALQEEREGVCKDLQTEARAFLSSGCPTPQQQKSFHLIYNLLRFQIHNYLHHMYSLLQAKLSAMELVQQVVGPTGEEADVRSLTITVTKGSIMAATIRLMERGLEAMRTLNKSKHTIIDGAGGKASTVGTGGSTAKVDPRPHLGEDGSAADESRKRNNVVSAKRNRLPKAAVNDMRTWLHQHWHNPSPTEEEKLQFARRHNIKVKQVENWFINTRMRVWRPAMRKALEHAEETGSYSEFSNLLRYTGEDNVYKKFLEEQGNGGSGGAAACMGIKRKR